MTYKVEFKVGRDSVFYTVRAENVIDAEELAKEKLKKDKRGYSISAWEVKHIENIPDV